MLTKRARHEFGPGDRQRGEQIPMLEKVRFQQVGTLGLIAAVRGSREERYRVAVDFSGLDGETLDVYCDCPRFAAGFACKHVWATLTKFDLLYSGPGDTSEPLVLFTADPDAVEIGSPLQSTLDTAPSRERPSAANPPPAAGQSGAKRKSKPPAWRVKLNQIVAAKSGDAPAAPGGLPAEMVTSSTCSAQHWFVFSVSAPANGTGLRVVSMRSGRKSNGQWGRPVAVEITRSEIQRTTDNQERQVFALLQPQPEVRSSRPFRFYDEGHRLHAVVPDLLKETLAAMHQTGRFAWKLGDSLQNFEDARPVDEVRIDQDATFRLRIAPDPDSRSRLIIRPELVIDASRQVSLDQLIWSSQIGCLLVQCPSPGEAPPRTAASTEEPSEEPSEGAAGHPGTADEPASDDPDAPAAEEGSPTAAEDEMRGAAEPIYTCLVTMTPRRIASMEAWRKTGAIEVPRRSLATCLEALSSSSGDVDLVVEEALQMPQQTPDPIPTCQLQQTEAQGTHFAISTTARYPHTELPFDSAVRWWFDKDERQLYRRNWAAEQQALAAIDPREFGFSEDGSDRQMELPPERFLPVVEALQQAGWEVQANEAPLRRATDFDIQIHSGVDWFDLQADVSFEGTRASLPKLLQSVRNGDRTIRLDDGTVGMLPENWLSKFAGVQDHGQSVDGAIRFHRSQALLLDSLLEQQPDVQRDRDYARFVRELKKLDGIKPVAAPKSFAGELRDYQRSGLGWLRFLQKLGFGGCLADDMGLGKTIQVLALLESRRKRRTAHGEPRKPSIVVVPNSLIFNWLDEAARFTPKLRIRNHTGTGRTDDWDAFAEAPESVDVLLTTYGTMRADASLLAQLSFDYAILDEAQAIKNPGSLVARAARLLPAEHRLAMTGTPVENHLGDLWSLFDFLNPGMLGNGKAAPVRLPKMDDPAQREQVQKIATSLQPFILRRTKGEVLKELPDKVEQTLSCEMSSKQRSLYDQLREHYRLHLSNKVEELGIKKAKIHVLEALLRLRQAACDPRLVDPNSDVRGAKIDQLLLRLDELQQKGGKAIVFSQFTSLLGLLRQDLDARGWQYEYLDGKTRQRGQKVERFQSDPDCPLFLISLKAGGHGLNLTAAECVFILDPWWNPAVEAQAIDRAHRLGQTQAVNAYRIICQQTVEQKIIELQNTKRDLADAIVNENKSLIGQLTTEDLQALLQ